MAATNYTPIQLYYSSTASAAPTSGNLANGELAINITDGKLYYKDNGGIVQVLATKGAGTIGGSTTQIQYNNAGALAGNAAMTFNSGTNTTTLTTLNLTNALGAIYGGTSQSAYTQGDVLYASATNTLSKLGIGTVNYILTSTGSVPQWVAPTSITVNTATNLAGGAAGSVPYQSGVATTTFLAIGAANTVMTSSGTAPQWGSTLTGLTGLSTSSFTNTSLTSGRVRYSTTGGLETDSANLTFSGTTLSTTGLSNTGLSTLVQTVKIGDSNFNGAAVFAAATPAKLYMGTGTVTDVTSAASATNTTGAIASLAITPIAATNTAVTYTNASTLYIAGAPSAGTNVTITNPYSLYVAGGASYFGGAVTYAGGQTFNGNVTVGASSANTLTVNSTITSNLIFTDNTYDIGASGATRPRTGYFGTSVITPSLTVSGLTSGRVPYVSTGGLLTDSANLTYTGLQLTNSTNSNSGTYIINRNVSTGTNATAYFNSDVTAAFSGYASFGSRSTGYTTSGMLEANSGGVFTSGLTNGLNIMTLDGYPVKFGVGNTEYARMITGGYLLVGPGLTTTTGFNEQMIVSSPATVGQFAVNSQATYNSSISHYVNKVAQWYTQALGDASQAYRIYNAVAGSEALRVNQSNQLLVGVSTSNYTASIITANPITTTWSGTIGLRYNVSGQTNNYYKGMTGTSIQNASARGLHIFNYDVDSNPGILFYPASYEGQTANPAMVLNTSNQLIINNNGAALDTALLTVSCTAGTGSTIPLSLRAGVTSDGYGMVNFRNQAGIQGNIVCNTGSIAMSGLSGLTFKATQVASADANTLDDYEEGTWTPALDFDGVPATSYTTQYGMYTKVGRVVTVSGRIVLNVKGAGTGLARIYGIPFSGGSFGDSPTFSGSCTSVTALLAVTGAVGLWLDNNGGSLIPFTNVNGGGTFTFGASWQSTSGLTFTMTYFSS